MPQDSDTPHMVNISVDDEVFRKLQELAEPLVDTPNSVLRRVLLDGTQDESVDGRTIPLTIHAEATSRGQVNLQVVRRAPSDELFPKEGFTAPILRSLVELGGTAPPRQIMERLLPQIECQLSQLDLEKPERGGVRWLSRAHFHRYELLDQGLIETPERGIWQITEKGRQYLDKDEDGC